MTQLYYIFNLFINNNVDDRATTDLVPSLFLAYNPLLKALTGLMVIAYIIHIGKII